MSRVRVYMAMSVDGYIAGPDDDISWLEAPREMPMASGAWKARPADALSYEDFTRDVGAMVMGRRTYDVVTAMGGDWFYGDLPIVLATSRALDPPRATVTPRAGAMTDLIAHARARHCSTASSLGCR